MASRVRSSAAARGLLLLLLALGLTLAAPSAFASSGAVAISAVHHDATVLPGRTGSVDPALHAPLVADLPAGTDPAQTRAGTATPTHAVFSHPHHTSLTSRGPPAG